MAVSPDTACGPSTQGSSAETTFWTGPHQDVPISHARQWMEQCHRDVLYEAWYKHATCCSDQRIDQYDKGGGRWKQSVVNCSVHIWMSLYDCIQKQGFAWKINTNYEYNGLLEALSELSNICGGGVFVSINNHPEFHQSTGNLMRNLRERGRRGHRQ